jgi:hypothetical protein
MMIEGTQGDLLLRVLHLRLAWAFYSPLMAALRA